MISSLAKPINRDHVVAALPPAWKEEARRLFHIYGPGHVPQPFEIEFLEKVAQQFESLEDLLALVPPRAIIQNFATNLWEFGKGVDTLTSYPWNISIPVADLCNARCTFCTSWLEGRKVLDLEQLEMFRPVLESAIYIGLVGHGEPLAHPRFDELCNRLQTMIDPMAQCYTITNGLLLEKWRDRLERVNLHSFSISLNAATPETHDEVMGLGRDAFPRIIQAIADLAAVPDRNRPPGRPGPLNNVYITMVVTRQNIAEIPAFIALGNFLGVTEIWLRSLLPQSELVSGLNYHLLPPYHHPEFENLRQAAVEAIAASRVPVQADPAMWDKAIFSGTLERRITEYPPAVISREQALRDRELRQSTAHLYEQPKRAFHGQPVADGAFSKVRWAAGRLEVVTPESDGAYAASVDITDTSAGSSRRLKVTFDADCKSGVLGFGLLDVHKDVWLNRIAVPANTSKRVALETELLGQPIRLIVMNGGSDCIAAQGSVGNFHIEPESIGQLPVDWTRVVACNSADPLDDGTSPLGREARFACKAVYYSLYVNELFYRMNPCCYLQRVPGHEEIRLEEPDQFVHAWNSPGMVALRRHLRDGPLFGACMRCPAKW